MSDKWESEVYSTKVEWHFHIDYIVSGNILGTIKNKFGYTTKELALEALTKAAKLLRHKVKETS